MAALIPSHHSHMGKQKTFMFINGGWEVKEAGVLLPLTANHISPVMNLQSSILKAIRIWLLTSTFIIGKLFIKISNG